MAIMTGFVPPNPFPEIWQSVPGHVGYEGSNWGGMRSFWCRKGRRSTISYYVDYGGVPKYLSQKPDPKGYISYRLRNSPGSYTSHSAQYWTLLTFVGPCLPGQEACHVHDPDPTCLFIWNLAWGSPLDNAIHRVMHGNSSPLTEEQVREIARRATAGENQHKLAEEFGVCQGTVSNLKRRVTWAHL
jgi:hypothetical protein